MSSRSVNIEDVCRTCLAEESLLYPIFDTYVDDLKDGYVFLSSVITTLTGIQYTRTAGYPHKICQSCKEIAVKALTFRTKSCNTEKYLKGILKQENPEVKNEKKDHVVVKVENIDTDDDVNNRLVQPGNVNNRLVQPGNVNNRLVVVGNVNNRLVEPGNVNNRLVQPGNVNNRLVVVGNVNNRLVEPGNVNNRLVVVGNVNNRLVELSNVNNRLVVAGNVNNRLAEPGNVNIKTENYTRVNIEPIESYTVNVTSENVQPPPDTATVELTRDMGPSYCPLCRVTYDDVNALTKHMWAMHADIMGPKKRGRPKKINTEIVLNKLLEKGLYQPKAENPFGCTFCNNNCKTKEDLICHLSTHKEPVYVCSICKKSYLSRTYYDAHLCLEEKLEPDINVSESSSSQTSKSQQDSFLLVTNVNVMQGKNSEKNEPVLLRQCKHCSAVASSPEELVDHIDSRHPYHSLKCKACDLTFQTLSASRAHRVRCENVERTFKCSSCPQRFTREVFLNKHILGHHVGQRASVGFLATEGSRLFQCDTCKQHFLKKSSLTKHMKNHNAEKRFVCEICNKRFFRNDNLKSHMRVHGVGNRSTTSLCLYCGRSFTCSSNFIVHMRRHTGEKPYKCDFCGKGFPRSSDLQCHRRSHTGEKPYICQICEKSFSRSNKLTRHMRVHTGSRPYKCMYCDKAFSQSNDLNVHVRRHTGDKPYVCEICGDRFIQGTALQSHRRSQGHFPPEADLVPLPPLTVDTPNPLAIYR